MNNFDKFATFIALMFIALLVTMCFSSKAKAGETVCMNLNVTVKVTATYPQFWDENGSTCNARTAEKGSKCWLRGWSTHYNYNGEGKSTMVLGSNRPVGQISVIENVCMTQGQH